MEFKITIPTDTDGYHTLECPFCNDSFKTAASDYDIEDIYELFCPYCGLIDNKSIFIPQKVIDHTMDIALNVMNDAMNNSLKKMKRSSKKSGMKFDYKPQKNNAPREITEEDDELQEVRLSCCGKFIKIYSHYDLEVIYCPYCGVI